MVNVVAVLDYAQPWTTAVDWSSFETAHDQVAAANGCVPAAEAEVSNRRLCFPPSP